MKFGLVKTSRGSFGFVARGNALVAAFLPELELSLRRKLRSLFPDAVEDRGCLPTLRRQVADYYAGKPTRFTTPIELDGVPPFRAAVLRKCHEVAYGETVSYADLAAALGRPRAARAVGGAMASNPIPLVIPCHRVLRSDGSLGGFSSLCGVEEKRRMLEMEGAAVTDHARPRRRAAG